MKYSQAVTIDYKNWKGERRKREVFPLEIWYGETRFHNGRQWFLKALNLEDNVEKDFCLADIQGWFVPSDVHVGVDTAYPEAMVVLNSVSTLVEGVVEETTIPKQAKTWRERLKIGVPETPNDFKDAVIDTGLFLSQIENYRPTLGMNYVRTKKLFDDLVQRAQEVMFKLNGAYLKEHK